MIGNAIYKILADDAGVGAICANQIYPQFAPQKSALPFITYDLISNVPLNSKGNTSHIDSVRVQLNCIADDPLEAANLAAAVRTALDGYAGTPAGTGVALRNVMFDGENDLLEEEDTFGRAVDYIFYLKK